MQAHLSLKLLLLSFVAIQRLESGTASRILAAFFFPCPKQFVTTSAIMRELLKRGHEVTLISPFSMAKENLGVNYTEILLPQYNLIPIFHETIKSKGHIADVSTLTFIKMFHTMGLETTKFAFVQPKVQELILAKDKVGKYDLLLAEQYFSEGALFLGHIYEIPTITVSALGFTNHLSSLVGTITPWSYVPHPWTSYSEHMSLMERIDNAYVSLSESLMRKYWYYPAHDDILRTQFSSHFDNLPTVKQLERNISAILLNSYMPLETPKPLSFNMIPVGGLHIQPAQRLPENIQRFLDEAKHGVIYFRLDSKIRNRNISAKTLQVFLNVFGSVKQRVLWKFDEDQLSHLPGNVMVGNHLPQNDILAHPNVKVFMSHGYFLDTLEAIQNGVPVLGMPVYADQFLTVKKVTAKGYAIAADYRTVTEQGLRHSLTELLENAKYSDNMKRASKVFRDRPLSAMDTAMFWIEYVIEHRGAPHMVSAGLDISWFQFYLLDIFVIVLTTTLMSLLGLCCICLKCKLAKKPKLKFKKSKDVAPLEYFSLHLLK